MVNEAGELEKKTHPLTPGHDALHQTAMEKKVLMERMGIGALKEETHMRLLGLLDFGERQTASDN